MTPALQSKAAAANNRSARNARPQKQTLFNAMKFNGPAPGEHPSLSDQVHIIVTGANFASTVYQPIAAWSAKVASARVWPGTAGSMTSATL
jgi:hypothetical protein